MSRKKVSETVTENIFRGFYGTSTFIEKKMPYRRFVDLYLKKGQIIVGILISFMIVMTIA